MTQQRKTTFVTAFDAAMAALDSDQAVAVHALRPLLRHDDGAAHATQGIDPGVVDVPIHELGKPRMTNAGTPRDRGPITPARLQQGLDLRLTDGGFSLRHAATLVKNSCAVKEQITRRLGNAHPVSGKSISHVVAANLRYWMEQADLTQAALAQKAGVNQKTISNYLNPEQRTESATGKLPSPKLEELDRIARALAVPVWRLVREMSDKERRLYDRIESAYTELIGDESATASAAAPARTKPASSADEVINKARVKSGSSRPAQNKRA